ncbi:MAG TPA: hypothetical protein VGH53_32615, partial [Streptosporangiaceae bacterium]
MAVIWYIHGPSHNLGARMIGIPGATNGDQALAARLQPYLRPGEDLLWCGRPDPAVFFTAADVIAIP